MNILGLRRNTCLLPMALLLSCGRSQEPTEASEPPAVFESQTAVSTQQAPERFADYLQSTFHIDIPVSEHYYVVIPAKGCLGCSLNALRDLANTSRAPNVTVIASELLRQLNNSEKKQLAQNVKLLADTVYMADNALDRLDLPFSTLTGIVHIRQGQPMTFIPFDNETYEGLFRKLPERKR